ncbi:hypothetical protein STRTUCAR8_02662, partial [Streptomyces turgidiscabies Car8]
EGRPDDAATAPEGGDGTEVDVPVVLGATRRDLVEALRVRHDLRRVQRMLDAVGERRRLRLAQRGRLRAGQTARGLAQRRVPPLCRSRTDVDPIHTA